MRRSAASGDGYLFRDAPEILALKALVSQRQGLVRIRSTLKQQQEAGSWKEAAAGRRLHAGLARLLKPVQAEIKALEGDGAI